MENNLNSYTTIFQKESVRISNAILNLINVPLGNRLKVFFSDIHTEVPL